MAHKPFGIALGFLGNLAVGLSMHRLIGTGSCGGDLPPCPDGLAGHIVMLPAGIIISVIAIFVGGGVFSFLGLFFAVGLGSMVAGLQSEDSGTQVFGLVFGGAFAGIATLVLALGWRGWTSGRKQAEQAMDLWRDGARGIGTVKQLQDTHSTRGDKHEVRVTMRVEPWAGTPPFEVTKAVYVTREERPRVGARFPVFYDDQQRSNWVYATDVDPAKVDQETWELFELALLEERAEAEQAEQAAKPRPPRPDDGPSDELAKLAELHAKGVLTAEEFAAAKARVLRT